MEYITHHTGTWTIRFLLITLCVTPLRKILNQPRLARYRRMLGLFAFFYVCLHFMTWFILDKSFSLSDMWADVLKRRFITVGMLGFAMLLPLAVTSTAGWVRRLGFAKWQRLHRLIYFAALAGVIHYYVAGEIRRAPAADVWRDARRSDAVPLFHLETGARETCARAEQPGRYHSEYGVPSRLVPSAPLRTSKIPGMVWFTVLLASSMISFQESALPVMGSMGTCRR